MILRGVSKQYPKTEVTKKIHGNKSENLNTQNFIITTQQATQIRFYTNQRLKNNSKASKTIKQKHIDPQHWSHSNLPDRQQSSKFQPNISATPNNINSPPKISTEPPSTLGPPNPERPVALERPVYVETRFSRPNISAEVRSTWSLPRGETPRGGGGGRSSRGGAEGGEWKKKLLAGSQWVRAPSRIPRVD